MSHAYTSENRDSVWFTAIPHQVTERAFGKYQGLDNSTQPVGFSAAVISYCARLASRQKQHQCSEVALSPGHAAGCSPARRPRVGPQWGKVTLSPGIRPGVLQSAIQELRAQTFHHPEAPEAIISLCAEAQMDTGRRAGWSSVNKPDCPALHPVCFRAVPSPSLVHRAEN